MNELEQNLREIQQKLQRSEREQRLLEDDNGLPKYQFTREDAVETLDNWGASGDLPNNDVARVIRRR